MPYFLTTNYILSAGFCSVKINPFNSKKGRYWIEGGKYYLSPQETPQTAYESNSTRKYGLRRYILKNSKNPDLKKNRKYLDEVSHPVCIYIYYIIGTQLYRRRRCQSAQHNNTWMQTKSFVRAGHIILIADTCAHENLKPETHRSRPSGCDRGDKIIIIQIRCTRVAVDAEKTELPQPIDGSTG